MMHRLSNILDASDSVQLTTAAIRLVGKCLLVEDCGGPITVKERNNFLRKLAAFDLTASLILSLSRLATWLLITLLLSSKPESLIIPGITDVIEVTNEELPVSILPKASESGYWTIPRSVPCQCQRAASIRAPLFVCSKTTEANFQCNVVSWT
jgi:hypothetical protein